VGRVFKSAIQNVNIFAVGKPRGSW